MAAVKLMHITIDTLTPWEQPLGTRLLEVLGPRRRVWRLLAVGKTLFKETSAVLSRMPWAVIVIGAD